MAEPFWLHPRDLVVNTMERVYRHGMTTTSGGNVSMLDNEGHLWITPAGIDKGRLRPRDVVCVLESGETEGLHRPSSEHPIHRLIYGCRPDIRAVLHAHPVALVSFSIAGRVPETRIVPQAASVCGRVGFAPYELPGSERLGTVVAEAFAEGHDCVVLENHGVVCGGRTLEEAYQRFETLDFCARLEIKASMLGSVSYLSEDEIGVARNQAADLAEFTPGLRTGREKELRAEMVSFVHRAYEHHLMTSTEGTLSTRLGADSFLITPSGVDRLHLDAGDIALIQEGRCETGARPSRAAALHEAIYRRHPDIHCIVTAPAPNSLAFAVADVKLDTRTIPESYLVLRDVERLPFGSQYTDPQAVAASVSLHKPVLLLANDSLLTVGTSILQAFDRVEVAEFTASSLLASRHLGPLSVMPEERLRELCVAFGCELPE